MKKFKTFLKIASILINIGVIGFLIFFFLWQPYREAKNSDTRNGQDLSASANLEMVYPTFAGSNQISSQKTSPDIPSSKPVGEKIKSSISEYFLPENKVYIFSSPYDYFNNPKNKTDDQVEKEILEIAGSVQCDPSENFVIKKGCYKLQKTNHAEFMIELSKSYVYYIFPSEMGPIASQTFSDGFVINKFHVNNFLQKKLLLHDSQGKQKDYYLYVFPAYNEKYLAGPFSGTLNISSP